MKISPLRDRVVVKRVDAKSVTDGGLVIPESAQEKPLRGIVVAIGQGKRDKDGGRIDLDVSVGDEVLFSKYAGSEVEIDGEDRLVLTEDEIIGVIEP